jgi:hypothetical protein
MLNPSPIADFIVFSLNFDRFQAISRSPRLDIQSKCKTIQLRTAIKSKFSLEVLETKHW